MTTSSFRLCEPATSPALASIPLALPDLQISGRAAGACGGGGGGGCLGEGNGTGVKRRGRACASLLCSGWGGFFLCCVARGALRCPCPLPFPCGAFGSSFSVDWWVGVGLAGWRLGGEDGRRREAEGASNKMRRARRYCYCLPSHAQLIGTTTVSPSLTCARPPLSLSLPSGFVLVLLASSGLDASSACWCWCRCW